MSWEQQEVFRILSNKPGTTYQEADDQNKRIIRDWLKSLLQATERDLLILHETRRGIGLVVYPAGCFGEVIGQPM